MLSLPPRRVGSSSGRTGRTGPRMHIFSKTWAHEVSEACQSPRLCSGSVCVSSTPQDCKPPGRGGGRKYLNCVGLFLGTFLPSLPLSFCPPPSSHLLIPSFSKSSDCLLWAQPWAGRCQEPGMIQTGVCPWGAPGLVRKVAW